MNQWISGIIVIVNEEIRMKLGATERHQHKIKPVSVKVNEKLLA
jgi:hypothetical protein